VERIFDTTQLNPEQEDWRAALIDDEDESVWAGEIRLQRDSDRWVLHVAANYEVEPDHRVRVRVTR